MADWLSTRSFSNNDLAASTSFAELGLDSIDAVELLSDYSDYFVHEVDPTVLWQYPTQEKLCAFLSEGLAKEIDARTEPRRQEENSAHVIECSLIDRLERELNEI
jgi:acyl carrier protein